MRLFVFEWVTGGGLAGATLPQGLVQEADLMLRAVLRDLADVPGITCVTTRDPRLPALPGVETLTRMPDESPCDLYRRGVRQADAAWPTAPERGGVLAQLARLTLAHGKTLLGSSPEAIRLTTSKHTTAAHLAQAGIPVVPTFSLGDSPVPGPGAWVVKPDDGAGAEDTQVVDALTQAHALLHARGPGYVLQPWLPGIPASLSLLAANGEARLLACNRQRIRLADGGVVLTALDVNAEASRAPALAPLASRIAAAIPGLWGYAGVDLLLTSEGPVVLEINPRLTTSYCGLRDALSANPAGWVIDLARTGRLPDTPSPMAGHASLLDLEPLDVR